MSTIFWKQDEESEKSGSAFEDEMGNEENGVRLCHYSQ